jgi:hypothetical protein
MGSTKIVQPSPPPAPTATQTAQDFREALPIYYQSALQYEPQIAKMEYDIQEGLYPQEAALRKQIGELTSRRLSEDIPAWYEQNVRDTLKSTLGRNLVYNPQAQEDFGLKTMQANQDWKNYYTNVALSMAGRIPVTTPNNMMSTYTPAANMGYNSQNYGHYANAYQNMYNSNAQYGTQNPWMNLGGSLGGAGIGALGTLGAASILASSIRYKKNVKLWAKH